MQRLYKGPGGIQRLSGVNKSATRLKKDLKIMLWTE